MSLINNLSELPSDLPVPSDDGACDHLLGMLLPSVSLPSTAGPIIDLAALPGRTVVFVYPRTGRPGQPALVDNWNEIPGARGCTPQACGYRDLAEVFEVLGVRIFGLSTQTNDYQRELVSRLDLPFSILSDAKLQLTQALRLPSFTVAAQTLLKRMAWVIQDRQLIKIFYPVFPADRSASEVLSWLTDEKNGALAESEQMQSIEDGSER